MKYITILLIAMFFTPVYANDAGSAPIKKGNLVLAKKRDHSQAAKETKKPAKSKNNKSKR